MPNSGFPLGQEVKKSQGIYRGSGKAKEIRNFLVNRGGVREENFYPRNCATSIKKIFSRRNVCR